MNHDVTFECDGVKLPSWYTLDFLNVIFKDYTSLYELRNQTSDLFTAPIWMEYLDLMSYDMLTLVELNLSVELLAEYRSYVRGNDWSNDLAIRRSCKEIDKAVKFLKNHFGHLRNKKVKQIKQSHLTVIK
jgi:hypothetical protein